jgi:hypothetical protein
MSIGKVCVSRFSPLLRGYFPPTASESSAFLVCGEHFLALDGLTAEESGKSTP